MFFKMLPIVVPGRARVRSLEQLVGSPLSDLYEPSTRSINHILAKGGS
jgi:hypothetical protein